MLAAMGLAGLINLAMLATAAAVFNSRGLASAGGDLGAVFTGLNGYLGAHSGTVFGVALLVSGIASSCVGTMSGQVGTGFSLTRALVLSQVLLSFGIPFALIPLVVFTSKRSLMGALASRRVTVAAAAAVAVVILALNLYLLTTA